jgi:hypothetical protein
MAVIIRPINGILADPTTPTYANAATVVAGAATCQAAVDQLGLLDGEDASVVLEANAVFAAMPAIVNQGILDALRSGFHRRARMKLHWVEDTSKRKPAIAHHVVEEEGWLHIHVSAPNGREFTEQF